MKKILIVLIIGLFFSCGDSKQFWEDNEINVGAIEKNLLTLEHEGCEYLVYSASGGYQGYSFGMHKGNCKNPIHKCN